MAARALRRVLASNSRAAEQGMRYFLDAVGWDLSGTMQLTHKTGNPRKNAKNAQSLDTYVR